MKWVIGGLLIVIAVISIPFALSSSKLPLPREVGRSVNRIAVAHLTGTITTGSTTGQDGVGRLVSFLEEARKKDDVRAIVLRVDSGGGTAAASQEVHRALMKWREDGKPVVVSMGEIAASGGYYVSVAADKIVANPSTITGSIGVISQFINVTAFAEKHGFQFETVATGPYKDIGNPGREMTPGDREILTQLHDDSLDQFIEAIADGRGLSKEQVREVADGRILTGRQALELGLIDDFGGLQEAIELAKDLAGLEGEPRLVRQAKPPASLWERLLGLSGSLEGIGDRFMNGVIIDRLFNGGSHLRIIY